MSETTWAAQGSSAARFSFAQSCRSTTSEAAAATDSFKAEDAVSAAVETVILDYRTLTVVHVRRAVGQQTLPK